MEINKNKEALKKSYRALKPYSEKYKFDFERFLFSLDLLFPKTSIGGKKILDIGSGIGIMAIALKNLGAQVTGADKFIFPDEEENFYTVANFKKLKRIWDESGFNVVQTDISVGKLPFGDNSFDIIICDATVEHLDWSPKDLFREVHRVLNSEGLFLVTTPNLANLLRRLRFLFGRSPNWDIESFFNSARNFRGHRREFTLNELVKMLEWSSFKIITQKTKNIFINPKRIFNPRKIFAQLCGIISYFFPSMREMIYVLAQKGK